MISASRPGSPPSTSSAIFGCISMSTTNDHMSARDHVSTGLSAYLIVVAASTPLPSSSSFSVGLTYVFSSFCSTIIPLENHSFSLAKSPPLSYRSRPPFPPPIPPRPPSSYMSSNWEKSTFSRSCWRFIMDWERRAMSPTMEPSSSSKDALEGWRARATLHAAMLAANASPSSSWEPSYSDLLLESPSFLMLSNSMSASRSFISICSEFDERILFFIFSTGGVLKNSSADAKSSRASDFAAASSTRAGGCWLELIPPDDLELDCNAETSRAALLGRYCMGSSSWTSPISGSSAKDASPPPPPSEL
mmetsp:Transcript_11532/g.28403  ORF Transcript_11532/g.28403 Transcript_11532/m.28403 type:complete len:305 (+) Transcript_11532:1370-2284(+)